MELRRLTQDASDFIAEWENDSPFVIAHTSGSTGTPKEVRLLKSDMQASGRATIRFFNLSPESCLFLPLSPSYIAGKMQIVRAIEAGCSLVVEEPSNHPLHTLPEDAGRISLLPIVPSQVDGVLNSGFADRIDHIIVGGAPLSPESEKRIIASGIPAYATYGMTETCSHVALRKLGEEEFTALPGFRFSCDGRGCLVIESDTMSFGRLVTNDIVSLTGADRFRWTGRFDNIINSGGLKIYPEEIERQISPLLPPGCRFYITSRPSAQWGEEAVLVTDMRDVEPDLLATIKTLVGSRRAPKAIVRVDEIPLTSSKKIIRKKISG